jgi:hypothetical protein
VFENRILKKILGPDREEVTEDWRKLQNEELYNLYPSTTLLRQVKLRKSKTTGTRRMVRRDEICKEVVS